MNDYKTAKARIEILKQEIAYWQAEKDKGAANADGLISQLKIEKETLRQKMRGIVDSVVQCRVN